MYAFSSSIQETEPVELYEFEASVVYGASSRTAKANQTNKQKEDTKNPTPIPYYDSRLIDH